MNQILNFRLTFKTGRIYNLFVFQISKKFSKIWNHKVISIITQTISFRFMLFFYKLSNIINDLFLRYLRIDFNFFLSNSLNVFSCNRLNDISLSFDRIDFSSVAFICRNNWTCKNVSFWHFNINRHLFPCTSWLLCLETALGSFRFWILILICRIGA